MTSERRERDGLVEIMSNEPTTTYSRECERLSLGSSDKLSPQQTVEEVSVEQEKRPNAIKRWSKWVRRRFTLTLMVLFTVAALFCAIGHGVFFGYLDGTMTEHRHIQQPHVTALSLLIVTAFKACIVAAVGLAFAQHLWRVLRQRALAIGRIDQLFSLRSNPIELTRVRGLLEAPILFSMAIFVWLVPLAAIYPPSALTVSFEAYSSVRDFNLAVLFPPAPGFNLQNFEFEGPRLSSLRFNWVEVEPKLNVSYTYTDPSKSLLGLARAVLLFGEIPQLQSPAGENASYSLQFQSPQLSCNKTTLNVTEEASFYSNGSLILFDVKWQNLPDGPEPKLIITSPENMIATSPSNRSFETFQKWYPNNTYQGQTNILTCQPVLATYELDISYIKTKRQITYKKRDYQPFLPKNNISYIVDNQTALYEKPNPRAILPVPTDFNADLKAWEQWALLDASLSLLNYSCAFDEGGTTLPLDDDLSSDETKARSVRPEYVQCGTRDPAFPKTLDMSIFNNQRYNESASYFFDPRTYNISEQTLNEYITNVTIAAMSLSIGKENIPVNLTEYRTTYHFSAPLNLILPYSLTLFFGTIFVIIGTWSLFQNGAAAMDGGFLQIMTTTIGRSKMEELTVSHHVKLDCDNIPRELLDLKVRYGELIDVDGVGTGVAGFGTLEETKMLRRRNTMEC